MGTTIRILLVGIGATAVMDAWTLVRVHALGGRAPDYGLLGRWAAHCLRGRFRHDAIAAAPRVRGERAIGWLAHYLTGIAFAALLVAVVGAAWLERPTPLPALAVGIATVAAPFLVMQPGMGLGIAARRAPQPNAVRMQSLSNHAVFGLGLWLAALPFA
ncbi:MAG TPA: DUF2938 domain-containing protein [Xanthomonadales bacterium]|nr:DUF2938 domain-containing protein [Xanthomonadales bacterium]